MIVYYKCWILLLELAASIHRRSTNIPESLQLSPMDVCNPTNVTKAEYDIHLTCSLPHSFIVIHGCVITNASYIRDFLCWWCSLASNRNSLLRAIYLHLIVIWTWLYIWATFPIKLENVLCFISHWVCLYATPVSSDQIQNHHLFHQRRREWTNAKPGQIESQK